MQERKTISCHAARCSDEEYFSYMKSGAQVVLMHYVTHVEWTSTTSCRGARMEYYAHTHTHTQACALNHQNEGIRPVEDTLYNVCTLFFGEERKGNIEGRIKGDNLGVKFYAQKFLLLTFCSRLSRTVDLPNCPTTTTKKK